MSIEWKEGFSFRVILATIYAAIVLQPIILFSQLYSGAALAGAAVSLSLVLFDQIGRMYGKPLTKQELFTLMVAAQTAAADIIYINLLWFSYLRISPITRSFGIASLIPVWIAPPVSSPVYLYRTIIHQDWLIPILVLIVAYSLYKLCNISLGLIAAYMYVEVEKLPFPMAQVNAEVITTLASREGNRMRIFIAATLLSSLYSLAVYSVPLLSEIFAGVAIRLIPFPWIDLNTFIETWLPGASFGIATDILVLGSGFVVPFSVAVSQFIGSFIVYFIGNHILVRNNLFPHWVPGMNVTLVYSNSILDFWASFIIGIGVAAAIAPFVKHPGYILTTIKTLTNISKKSRELGYLSVKMLLLLYLLGSLGLIAMSVYLVPGFIPYIYILLMLSPVWAFISTLISARALGLTGYQLTIPYVREMAFVLTPYQGVDIWFAPIYTPSTIGFSWPTGGASWSQTLKICWLTQTKLSSIYKGHPWLQHFIPARAVQG